jgi:transmembrane sensor
LIEQVNRYSPVTLELGDPQLASIAIGGRFRIGDLDAVLDVLEANFGIWAHRVDEHDIRLESGRGR